MGWGLFAGVGLGLLQIACLPLVRCFSPLPEVRAAARTPAFLSALAQPVNGVAFVAEGVLLGLGAFRFLAAQTAVGALAFSGFAGRAFGQDAAVEPAKVPDQNDAVQAEAPSPDAFTFDTLTARMKARAAKPYQEPVQNVPAPFEALHYDDYRAVRYDPNKAIWRDQSDFQLQAFSLGWLFKTPVEIYEVANGKAEKLVFSASDFIFRAPLDAEQFKDVELPGVAGFRINYPLNRSDISDELISFLGSSYFRALGQGNLYGLSARGLAINTATNEGEEFPRFSAFYIVRPAAEGEKITVFAELDGPSVAGAALRRRPRLADQVYGAGFAAPGLWAETDLPGGRVRTRRRAYDDDSGLRPFARFVVRGRQHDLGALRSRRCGSGRHVVCHGWLRFRIGRVEF